jgi:hypothetical protein
MIAMIMTRQSSKLVMFGGELIYSTLARRCRKGDFMLTSQPSRLNRLHLEPALSELGHYQKQLLQSEKRLASMLNSPPSTVEM